MILCIGLSADRTFAHTVRRFHALGEQIAILDLAVAAATCEVNFDNVSGVLTICDQHVVTKFDGSTKIFCRIINPMEAAPSAKLSKRTSVLVELIMHWMQSIPRQQIINPPSVDRSNNSKLVHQKQLHEAIVEERLSLKTPKYCVTNIKKEAAAFMDECNGQVIYKGASSSKSYVRKLEIEDLDIIDNGIPVLLQQQIIGDDIRVHVVGNKCFAEKITFDGIDYRFRIFKGERRFMQFKLDRELHEYCRNMTKKFGLHFSGIDIKECSQTGSNFILELNSMPGYTGYDVRADYVISKEIFAFLTR